MFCKNCGKVLKDSAKFCSGCGSAVEPQPEQPQQTPPPQPQVYQQQPYGQPAPPPGQTYQQPYGQPAYTTPGYNAKPAAQKARNKLFIIIAIAVAAVVIIGLIALSSDGAGGGGGGNSEEDNYFTLAAFTDKPPGNEAPFELGDVGFTTDDPNIKMIEINQGMSYGFDTDTGELYIMENFVAGKETAIFVALEKPVDKSSEITLTVLKNGDVVGVMTPSKMVDANTILFQPKDMGEMENWGEGAYAFVFEMDGSKAVRVSNFFATMALKVLAVPVLANYSGKVHSCVGDWKAGSTMLTATYPVAQANVDYVLAPELDLSAARYDLDTDEGQYNVWEALKNLQTPNNDYTLIVGFIRYPANNGQFLGYTFGLPANIVCESEPDLYATVVHEIAHCYLIGDEYDGGSLNNELNAPPYRMPGHDIVTRKPTEGKKSAVVGGFELGINGSGSVIYEEQRAYWVEGREMLDGLTSFMGSGTGEDSFKFWTTSDIWNHLFNAFTGQSTATLGGGGGGGSGGGGGGGSDPDGDYWGQCFICYSDVYDPIFFIQCHDCFVYTAVEVIDDGFTCFGCGRRQSLDDYYKEELFINCNSCENLIQYVAFVEHNGGTAKVSGEAEIEFEMVTEITGYIETDGTFVSDPWYSYLAPTGSPTACKGGEYSARVYDAKGETLTVTYFEADSYAQTTTAKAGQQFEAAARIPISVVIKYPENAAKVVILKGDEDIYSRDISKCAPSVSVTGVSVDSQAEDRVTVTWDASDADGDTVYYWLYYCIGQEEYYSLATNITDNSFTINMSDYPGSDQGYFFVYATDGINTAEAHSDCFNISYTAPFFINDATETLRCKITEELVFDPQAYDNQDGRLDWSSVVWLEDGKDYMDAAELWILPYQVEAGTHVFTCVATNSAGKSTSRDFKVEILDDESDLPDDWSRDDIRYALQNGFYLPLEWLDAPITRSQFSRQMAFVYGAYSTLPEIYPQFSKGGIVTDCGSNELFEAMMVYIGVMDAPDGLFEPQRSMTELEGALIMYKVAILADNQDFSVDDFVDDEIISTLMDIGVLEESGPNAFDPDNKLTGKATLVRLSKLFRYSFED